MESFSRTAKIVYSTPRDPIPKAAPEAVVPGGASRPWITVCSFGTFLAKQKSTEGFDGTKKVSGTIIYHDLCHDHGLYLYHGVHFRDHGVFVDNAGHTRFHTSHHAQRKPAHRMRDIRDSVSSSV